MIDRGFLTKHERGMLLGALRDYEQRQQDKARTKATAKDRGIANANAYVAGDLVRQLLL